MRLLKSHFPVLSRRIFVSDSIIGRRQFLGSLSTPKSISTRIPSLASLVVTTTDLLTMPDKRDLDVEASRALLKQQFTEFSGDRYTEGWADLWAKGDFLPWDRQQPSPALADTLINGAHLIGSPFVEEGGQRRRKRALVPGCGRGVDVLLLQTFGYDAIGLEVSPKAVEACEEFAKEKEHEYLVKDDNIGKGNRQFVLGDFYKDDWFAAAGLGKGAQFELIYDYTVSFTAVPATTWLTIFSFFCAMNPSMRPAWAKRMSELLAPNQFSQLVCLEFPGLKPPSAGGPPFSSPPKAYMEHLSHPGQEIAYSEEGEVRVNPLAEISPGGLERIAHFRPTDTHQIGKDADGKVTDRVSIWRHRY